MFATTPSGSRRMRSSTRSAGLARTTSSASAAWTPARKKSMRGRRPASSPRACVMGFPTSSVSVRASGSARSTASARKRRIASQRSASGFAAHAGCVARARRYAAATAARSASATSRSTSPVAGFRTCIPATPSLLVARSLEERAVLPVALRLEALHGYEAQRRRVHAEALAGRRRPVVEHVPQVRAGMRGADFRARGEEAPVLALADVPGLERPREAGPAGAGVVLVERAEERLAGDDVDVDAGPVVVPVLVAEGRLRALVLGHPVLHGGERLLQRGIIGLLEGHGIPSFLLRLLRAGSERGQDEERGGQRVPHGFGSAAGASSPHSSFRRASRPPFQR